MHSSTVGQVYRRIGGGGVFSTAREYCRVADDHSVLQTVWDNFIPFLLLISTGGTVLKGSVYYFLLSLTIFCPNEEKKEVPVLLNHS